MIASVTEEIRHGYIDVREKTNSLSRVVQHKLNSLYRDPGIYVILATSIIQEKKHQTHSRTPWENVIQCYRCFHT